jgi:hypothetical protein
LDAIAKFASATRHRALSPQNGRTEGSAPLNWDVLARNELARLEQQADMLRAIECGEFAASELPAEYRHGDIPAFAVDAQ